MSLNNININDPLDYQGIKNNFINDKIYSNEYKNYAKKWSEFPMYKDKDKLINLFNLINEKQVILLTSGTGSGKTVLIPKYILKYMIFNNINGITCITNPKKLTTLYNAEYGAKTLDVELGNEVGYKFKGSISNSMSENTKLLYATDGLLLSIILNKDPLLKDYNCVIIDEAHERNIQIDLLLYFLKQIIQKRNDFKLIIMSATINSSIFSNYYNTNDINYGEIHFLGKNYPISQIWYNKDVLKKDYKIEGVNFIKQLIDKTEDGDIIMFVATEKETNECCKLLKNYDNSYCAEVYGKMKEEKKEIAIDKDKYKNKGYKRKIIFATNVAESSITVDGLKYVIDGGYELINYFDAEKNMIIIKKDMTTQAQIKQRIGRVGRTSEGIAYHLYTQKTYDNLKDYPDPNIRKSDITLNILNFFNYTNTLNKINKIINNLITKPYFNQYKLSIHKLLYYNIIKLIKKSLDTNEDKYKYNKVLFNDINFKLLNDYDDFINYNGTIKTVGHLLNRFKLSSIEMGLCLLNSYYMNCNKEMIIIVSILECCEYKLDNLFTEKNVKKVKNIFRKSIVEYSDHITLLNIYFDNYKNENFRYLNLKIWNKVETKIDDITKRLNKIKLKKYEYINKDNQLINKKIFEHKFDNLCYSLYNGLSYNSFEKKDNKYISLNYINNSEAQIEKLFFIKQKNKHKIGVGHFLNDLFGRKLWKIITFIPEKILK